MSVHKEITTLLSLWVHAALVSLSVEFVLFSHSVFSVSDFQLLPTVSCLAPLLTKSNLFLTDNLYNLLGCRSLKNIFVFL